MASFVSPKFAAELIRDGMSLGICSFGGWLGADLVFRAIADRFEKTGSPSKLSIFSGILPGNLTEEDKGMNILAKDGLICQVCAAHVGMSPKFGRMIGENRLKAYAFPLGIVSDTLHAAASGKPYVVSPIGLGTFCDPRVEGGALNDAAAGSGKKVAELTEFEGEEYLLYKAPRLDACIIRVSTVDEKGNLSTVDDPMTAEQLEMAMAVKASGGIVIAQADRMAAGTLGAKDILLHKSIVDYIVLDEDAACQPGYDCPSFRPELCGYAAPDAPGFSPMEMGHRKICGRRGALELEKGSIVNLGIGMPDSVAAVAGEEGIFSDFLLSVESGPLGGVPVGGVSFGASAEAEVIYRLGDNFDFYDGGGLDMAILGAGEIDEQGNVNVSRFGIRTTGPGGFINIVQSTPKICFMCTFTTAGLRTAVEDSQLKIVAEGKNKKFCKKVQQITFSAEYARKKRRNILYITERAVFTLGENGLVLTEIAPGMDLEKDILSQMDFVPQISPELKEMDKSIFRP